MICVFIIGDKSHDLSAAANSPQHIHVIGGFEKFSQETTCDLLSLESLRDIFPIVPLFFFVFLCFLKKVCEEKVKSLN